MNLLDYLPTVPDFPKPGIMFKDISPLLANQKAFAYAIDQLYDLSNLYDFDYVLGIESRGFIFATALAQACKEVGTVEQSYYRWRKIYGGMKVDQARKYKDLELENTRLKKLVADLSLREVMLKEVIKGNF